MSRRIVIASLLSVVAVLAGLSHWIRVVLAAQQHGSAIDRATLGWVTDRVRAWLPNASEHRWETAGWVTEVVKGEQLSRQTHRPMFLVCVTGDLTVGHC